MNGRRALHSLTCLLLAASVLPLAAQTPPAPATNSLLVAAIAKHGAEAVRGVTRIRVTGQSTTANGSRMPIVISADLIGGNSRLDYGNPVTRSVIQAYNGTTEIRNGRKLRKPGHVGIFAQFDLLSIFGIKQLETGNVAWTELAPVCVGGRAASGVKADTGETKEFYRRTLRDQADIRFDSQTGLVAAITRLHYGEKSVDLAVPVSILYSDYRIVDDAAFPFRIDIYLNASLMESITVTNVELNPALTLSIFER